MTDEKSGALKNQEKWERFGISMELFGNILKTTDYSLFKKVKGNRTVNKANLNAIVTSMEQQQLITPIMINEKYEIIDGQHRFEACKTLKLPVYFYVVNGYGTDEIKRCNTTGMKWNKGAFLESYMEQEYENYILFNDLLVSYNITISLAIKLLAHFQNKTSQLIYFSSNNTSQTMVIY